MLGCRSRSDRPGWGSRLPLTGSAACGSHWRLPQGVADLPPHPPPPAVLNQDIPHIFALTLFEDYVYWTDWETKSINRAHKTTGANKTLLISTLHRPMDLHVFHALRQPDGESQRVGAGGGGSMIGTLPVSPGSCPPLLQHREIPEAVDRPWSGSPPLSQPGPRPGLSAPRP